MSPAPPSPAATHARTWPWLLAYAGRHRAEIATLAAVTLAGAVIPALAPLPLKVLVDHALVDRPMGPALREAAARLPGAGSAMGVALWSIAAFLLLQAAAAGVRVLHASVSTTLAQRLTYDAAADLLAHMQLLSLRFHARQSVGDAVRRVTSDCNAAAVLVRDAALPALAAAVTVSVMLFVLLCLHTPLALLASGAIPVLGLVVWRCTPPMIERGYEYGRAEGAVCGIAHDAIVSAPVIQAFGAEDAATARLRAGYDAALAAAVCLTAAQFRLKVLGGAVTTIASAAVVWLGAGEVLAGRLSLGGLLVFLAYLVSLVTPIDGLVHAAGAATTAAGSARRVLEVMAQPEEVAEAPGAPALVLRSRAEASVLLEAVTFGYDPGRPVLRDVSLHISPGATVALVGRSGGGKSTLAVLIPRLLDPWSGRVLIAGHDVRSCDLRSVRRQVSIVLQDSFLFPVSVAENIAYGRPGAPLREIEAAAEAAGAAEFIAALPRGYDTAVGEYGASLSAGQRQRLAIARALLKDAPVLILDEPTSNLDPATETAVLAALDRLRRGRTTLIIAHRLTTIHSADTVAVLDDGRIIEAGRHDDLVRRGGLYAEVCADRLVPPMGPRESPHV